MILNKTVSPWLFSKADVVSHELGHLLCFTNFPVLWPTGGCDAALAAYPLLRAASVLVIVHLLGLEDRNPGGERLSYLFTLLVIIQPSFTHFCLFIFSSHSV